MIVVVFRGCRGPVSGLQASRSPKDAPAVKEDPGRMRRMKELTRARLRRVDLRAFTFVWIELRVATAPRPSKSVRAHREARFCTFTWQAQGGRLGRSKRAAKVDIEHTCTEHHLSQPQPRNNRSKRTYPTLEQRQSIPKTCPHQHPTAPTPPLPQQQTMPATLLVSSARSSALP